MREFRGRVAVITGAASGIGLAVAEECVRRGMRVAAADVDAAALSAAAAALRRRHPGAEVVCVPTDVTRPDDLRALRDAALRAFGGKVHLLFSNAGAAGPGSVLADRPAWDWILKLNLVSVIDGMREFVPTMVEQGEEAHIVATASIYGLHTGRGPYGVTKQAVVAVCEATQLELREAGHTHVTVSALCPSWVKTGIMRNRAAHDGSRPRTADERHRHAVSARFFDETAAEMSTVVDAFFAGVEQRRNYIHTHPQHSELMLESRVGNILRRGVIDDDERYRAFFAAREAAWARIDAEMRGAAAAKL